MSEINIGQLILAFFFFNLSLQDGSPIHSHQLGKSSRRHWLKNKTLRAIATVWVGTRYLEHQNNKHGLGVLPNPTFLSVFGCPIYPWGKVLLQHRFLPNPFKNIYEQNSGMCSLGDLVSGFWRVLSFLIVNLNGRNISQLKIGIGGLQ